MTASNNQTISKSMRDALLDMLDGRVLARGHFDWGGYLNPMEVEGKKRRVFLGNVKRVTINALVDRGLIEIVHNPGYAAFLADTDKIVYGLSNKGREACSKL